MKTKYVKFPKWFDFSAINLFGYVLINIELKPKLELSPKLFERMIRHESIHSAQGREMLWLLFYLVYYLEWIVRLVQYRKSNKKKEAYRNISFEREAYANEGSIDYLKKRKWYTSLRYLKDKNQTFLER